jgi:hypothetical protein
VVLTFSGNERNYKDANGHFSLTKWKARVDRYKDINFSSYISDGTIIGHWLVDEPQDPTNWNGTRISQSTLEEMAKYSKQRWPDMVTIVRTWPDYLDDWSGDYYYLDAAWAQYVAKRFPDLSAFVSSNVSKAKAKGLALVVGLMLTKGSPTGGYMSASQIETYGSALLSNSYPCAFISYQYGDYAESYLTSSSIENAMDVLRAKAQNHGSKSCGNAGSTSEPAPAPEPSPEPSPEPTPEPSPVIGALPFGLSFAPAQEYSTRWTGTLYRATPTEVVQRLGSAESAGMRIVVQLAAKGQSKNADGTFSLTKWKAAVDGYRSLRIGTYISDGTFYLHHLVDQPNCASCWGGKAIPWDTVEEMARYSKSIWPALPTTVRVAPSVLAGASFRWTWLDAGWAQYNTRLGDLRTYLARQAAQAKLEGLGLVVGLNVLDGAGYGTASMTASQIKQFGTILAQEPSACALIGWSYNASYLSQSGIRQALDSVATVAKRRNAGSCIAS